MLVAWLDFFLDFLCLDFLAVVDMYDESAVFEFLVEEVEVLLEGWSGLGFFGKGGVSSSSCIHVHAIILIQNYSYMYMYNNVHVLVGDLICKRFTNLTNTFHGQQQLS